MREVVDLQPGYMVELPSGERAVVTELNAHEVVFAYMRQVSTCTMRRTLVHRLLLIGQIKLVP